MLWLGSKCSEFEAVARTTSPAGGSLLAGPLETYQHTNEIVILMSKMKHEGWCNDILYCRWEDFCGGDAGVGL